MTATSDASSAHERRRPTGEDVTRVYERDLLAALLFDPELIPVAFAGLNSNHMNEPGLRAVAVAMLSLYASGAPISLPVLHEALVAAGGLDGPSGIDLLFALTDEARPQPRASIEYYARRIETYHHERELERLLVARCERPNDAALREQTEAHEARIAELERGPADVLLGAFTGDRLRAVRERPESVSPMPKMMDPEPHLHLLQGKPKSGKTTYALAIARAWACGVPPWAGAPALPSSRVLVISREQNVNRIDATLRRLDAHAHSGDREKWTDRIAIVARDADLGRDLRRLLTLDAGGIELLRAELLRAKAAGDPFGLLVLDSLSRLKPPEVAENDPGEMAVWLDALEDLAEECSVYVLLIHHAGHSTDPTRGEARSAGRGASSISAVAQVAWLLERVPESPNHRLLKVDGNAILPTEIMLEVADTTADEGSIHYFRPGDLADGHEPEQYLKPGDEITTSALAWLLAGKEPEAGERPPGAFAQLAGALRNRWERAGLVTVKDGKQRAKVIQLYKPGPKE